MGRNPDSMKMFAFVNEGCCLSSRAQLGRPIFGGCNGRYRNLPESKRIEGDGRTDGARNKQNAFLQNVTYGLCRRILFRTSAFGGG